MELITYRKKRFFRGSCRWNRNHNSVRPERYTRHRQYLLCVILFLGIVNIWKAAEFTCAGTLRTPQIQNADSVEKGIIRIEWKADPLSTDFQIRLIDIKSGSYTTHSTYDSKGNVETVIQGSAVVPGKTARVRIRTVRMNSKREEYSRWSKTIRVLVAAGKTGAKGKTAAEQTKIQKDSSGAGQKKKQTIRLLTFPDTVWGKKNKILHLKAQAKGKVTFTGNRPDVAAVSADGTVTVHRYGKVSIVMRAKETAVYKKAVKKKTLVIRPARCSLSVKKTGSGAIRIHWKRDGLADGYEIQYSFSRTFSGTSTRNGYTRSNRVVNTSVSGLGTGKNCYVRVRSYINWKGKRLTGKWKTVQVSL